MNGRRIRALILASQPRGFGAYCLPAIAAAAGIEVAAVIECEGVATRPWLRRWRKLQKIARIGVLGALQGVRMRRWYDLAERLAVEPLESVAARHGIPFHRTASTFSASTSAIARAAAADIGLSLGNGYIPERLFSVPRLGMINVHHELLPEFKGAQSVIWQLYHGSTKTGFTIHRIDRRIDGGAILYREAMPVRLQATLEATVRESYAMLWEASRDALVRLLPDVEAQLAAASPQGPGRTFTTPSYWQFRRIARAHARLAAGR